MRWLRLALVALVLAPLPLAAATLSDGAVEARGLPRVAVTARDRANEVTVETKVVKLGF